ncbi:hypothetical protein D3C71_1937840 [compost metagenome]
MLSSLVSRLDSQYATLHFLHELGRDLTTMNKVLLLLELHGMYQHSQVHHKYGQAKHVHAVNSQMIFGYPTSF